MSNIPPLPPTQVICETQLEQPAQHAQYAHDYDRLTAEYHCYAAEVLFGLLYEYVQPGQHLLDLGIGTGLSAAPFAKAGLVISGADFAPEMLAVCRAKGFAVDLRLVDLSRSPWPYPPRVFDHALACGLLHFFETLDSFLASAVRVLRPGGCLAFTTKPAPAAGPQVVRVTAQGQNIYLHSPALVADLAARHGLTVLKDLQFYVGADLFTAYVTRAKAA
jgi:predicted TPR repeat methyltransferase